MSSKLNLKSEHISVETFGFEISSNQFKEPRLADNGMYLHSCSRNSQSEPASKPGNEEHMSLIAQLPRPMVLDTNIDQCLHRVLPPELFREAPGSRMWVKFDNALFIWNRIDYRETLWWATEFLLTMRYTIHCFLPAEVCSWLIHDLLRPRFITWRFLALLEMLEWFISDLPIFHGIKLFQGVGRISSINPAHFQFQIFSSFHSCLIPHSLSQSFSSTPQDLLNCLTHHIRRAQ